MKGIKALAAAAAVLLLAPPAEAAVVYAFRAPGGLSTYVSPGFVTSDTGPHALGACTNSDGVVCGSVVFDTAPSTSGAHDLAELHALDGGLGFPVTYLLPFAPGAFGTEGVHSINPVTELAVVEIDDDYAAGSVLYLLTTPLGAGTVVTQGFAKLGGYGLAPNSCESAIDQACVSLGFGVANFRDALVDGVYQEFTRRGLLWPFAPGAVSSPGVRAGLAPGVVTTLWVIPLPGGATSAAPEPSAWVLALTGFALAGVSLRPLRGRRAWRA